MINIFFSIQKKSKACEFNAEPAHGDTKLEDCRNGETDIDSTTVFGEFDPDAFEVLDEVGGDDDPLPISNLADEADLQVDPSRIHENQTDSHMINQEPQNDANGIKEADAYTLAEETHKNTYTALSSGNENLRQEFYVKTEDAATSQKNPENDDSSGQKRHLIEDLALDHAAGRQIESVSSLSTVINTILLATLILISIYLIKNILPLQVKSTFAKQK